MKCVSCMMSLTRFILGFHRGISYMFIETPSNVFLFFQPWPKYISDKGAEPNVFP